MNINDPEYDLYGSLGIDTNKLGCVMLDVELIPRDIPEEMLVDPTAKLESHVTLLYGLLANAHIWREQVDWVMRGWTKPAYVVLSTELEVWSRPNSDGVLQDILVAKVIDIGRFQDANQRLAQLPHINMFPIYNPHVTVAYCKFGMGQRAKQYVVPITPRRTIGLNYGDLL